MNQALNARNQRKFLSFSQKKSAMFFFYETWWVS